MRSGRPGRATTVVHDTVPTGVPAGGWTTSRPASVTTHDGAPLLLTICSASASLAMSETGTSRTSPRPMPAERGRVIGSWLTSIVIVPFARWRQPFTTAYVIVALPFSPAGGV